MSSDGLQVACHPAMMRGADFAFTAERLTPPLGDHWVLYLTSDQIAVDLRRVSPDALGHALDTDGALGLVFPATVTTVELEVGGAGSAAQHWSFWLDDLERIP